MSPITLHEQATGHEVRIADDRIGNVRPGNGGWYAHPATGWATFHHDQDAAVAAVVHAHTGGGYLVRPAGEVSDR